ncbi:hypothetical protein K2173_004477 [Erythroxylum novogranatense]|uniref:Ribosomal protein S11 n=1 Tax=Erythroxylum novogranatense TaxID=1862640 RepID=A0AAV8T5P8_9ROSI|nr:hypothetical protein K2173_004477 [Erythroxylum novogranatense]
MQRVEVIIKGPGLGRDATLRVIHRSGILLNSVRDVTPMPHNSCRTRKLTNDKSRNLGRKIGINNLYNFFLRK